VKRSGLFAILLASLCSLLPASAMAGAAIEVNAGREIGPLPFLFRSGMFWWGEAGLDGETLKTAYLQKKFLQDQKPGSIEANTFEILDRSKSFAGYKKWLRSQPVFDAFAKRVDEQGGKVVIPIIGMPRWLTSQPNATKSIAPEGGMAVYGGLPPSDYEKWADVVQATVEYYSNTLGLDAWYKVWWEPDTGFWQGTEEEFFKLYKYAVIGARRANKNAKIGGPSVSGEEEVYWRNREQHRTEPMIYNLIRYCAQTPVPELGLDRVPIDFLVWHQFNGDPSTGFRRTASQVKGWLKSFGYRETTPMLIGEWSVWRDWPKFLDPGRDTNYAASYAIASLIGMDQAGITHHAFTSIIEQGVEGFKGEFGGDFGIFTKSLVIKPVYNAFRTLSYLGETRLEVAQDDPFLAAVSTSDKRGVTLLIANYAPDGEILRGAVRNIWQEKGHKKEELARYGLTREKLGQLLREFKERGRIDLQGLQLPDVVKRDIQEIEAFAQTATRRSKEATEVNVLLRNLPPDLIRYERYVIDASHSNSYAVRSRVEAALAAAPQEARQQAESFLLQRGRSGEEIKRLEAQLRSGDPRLKEQVDPDARAAYALYRNHLASVLERINNQPEVALQKVEEKNLTLSGDYRETLQMAPYSVTLIRLTR
jgi:hypothetical protein